MAPYLVEDDIADRHSSPAYAAPVVRFEGLRCEFSQHDFGHVDVCFVDGLKMRVHFFASRFTLHLSLRSCLRA